jgi:hypothetical protein
VSIWEIIYRWSQDQQWHWGYYSLLSTTPTMALTAGRKPNNGVEVLALVSLMTSEG